MVEEKITLNHEENTIKDYEEDIAMESEEDFDSDYEEDLDLSYEDDESVAEFQGLSPMDSYIYSMRHKARVDLDYMSVITGCSKEELVDELIGKVIWPSPEEYERTGDYFQCFSSKQQYLRGNLIKKYENAKHLNEKTGMFEETVLLLKEALPDTIDPQDIHMNLGASWIPKEYVELFLKNLFELYTPPRVEYNELLGKWLLDFPVAPDYVKDHYIYGTLRMGAVQIVKHIMNASPIKVYDQVPKLDRDGFENKLNQAETLAAQQKEQSIRELWQEFIHADSQRERSLQEIYMLSYGYGVCRYDGNIFDFPGLNKDIHLHKHQRAGIEHILLGKNTLLAAEVGAGKSYMMICGVHELERLKLGNKALFVVPNSTLEAMVTAYQEAYPQDEIFVVYPKKQFAPSHRQETLRKIRENPYKVIFMGYSSFDMLSISKNRICMNYEKKIAECEIALFDAPNYSVHKALESELKKLNKEYWKIIEGKEDTLTACFDMLGIDILVVDEAHNYKNISLDTKANHIVGVNSGGSKKANSMMEKVEFIQEIGGHVIFATGTPITNSMADIYTMQRYLQPSELKLCNIYHFSDWINSFGELSNSFEIDVDGSNFRYTTRFSKFHNLPELMALFSDVCEFYKIENGELGLPQFDGYTDVLVKKSPQQCAYIKELAERTEDIRARRVKRNEDNLLLITVDGRKCALDIRLVNPEAIVGEQECKVNVCAMHIVKIYHEYPGTAQVVFSDLSTPQEGFNVYDELKSELVKRGIPANEIMFIHEATTEQMRTRIEKDFNAGKIRVLIGSTQKLGTGCNIQERLIACHHLDIPWRPADEVQREGRIIRQGNSNERVFVYRYITESSFDAFSYQLLESKQKSVAQFLAGSLDAAHRDATDCADTVLSYAEVKALAIGNPLIKKRVEVANLLEHAKINRVQKRKELQNLSEVLEKLPNQIGMVKRKISNARLDAIHYRHHKQSISIEEREMFGEELFNALREGILLEQEKIFDNYQGFDVVIPSFLKPDEKPYIILRRPGSNSYKIKMDGNSNVGCSRRLDYVLEHMPDTIGEYMEELECLYRRRKEVETTLRAGNEFDQEVDQLAERLVNIDQKLAEPDAS